MMNETNEIAGRADRFARRGLVLALPVLFLAAAACSDSPFEGNDDHAESARVEIETRGPASALIAEWIDGEGWLDADGNPITELPDPVDRDDPDELEPMQAGGTNASLTVRFFWPAGDEVNMATLSRDDDTGVRECTEFSARYAPMDDATDVIAWPNMAHPDDPDGPHQFAERSDDTLVGIFHCDHIHFYPENEGTVDVEFLLWHIDHADDRTDPITVRVE